MSDGHGHSHAPGEACSHGHGVPPNAMAPFYPGQPGTFMNQQLFPSGYGDLTSQMPITAPLSGQARLLDTIDAQLIGAAKTGALDVIKELVEQNGSSCLLKAVDHERGCNLVHWAAINGHIPILEYLSQQGMSLTAETDPPTENQSAEIVRQQAIHLAAARGHVPVVDWLIRNGISIDAVDSKGVTPIIAAAQYNQVPLLTYLLAKGANTKQRDREGDGPLQWAAFKGNAVIVRMLLDLGFDPLERDAFEQTALHLASIKGHMDVIRELMGQGGMRAVLTWTDKNGRNPIQLAENRGHTHIVSFYKSTTRSGLSVYNAITSVILGPPERQRFALIFFILNFLLFCYPVYLIKCVPLTWPDFRLAHCMFGFFNAAMWVCYWRCLLTDPGFVPSNSSDYDMAMKQLANPAFDWSRLAPSPGAPGHVCGSGRNPLARLCHTCRVVKPLRSKHCRVCGRCVRNADHHCPWVNNCVGKANRSWFYGFIVFISCMDIWIAWFSYQLIMLDAVTWLIGICLADVFIFGFAIFVVCIIQSVNMLDNLTTNERFNWRRYAYFRKSDGSYINPFSRGRLRNVLEYFNVVPERVVVTEEDEMFSSKIGSV